MPIIAKHIIDARRAALAAAAQAAVDATAVPISSANPDAGKEYPSRVDEGALNEAAPSQSVKPAKRRGHAVKDENGKYQPTAPYPNGFAKTPEHSRFKPGCKGGPGRPKGSVSHDTLLAKHLRQKREVGINGSRQQLSLREILIMSTVKSALEGKDKQARAYILAQDQRLHPAKDSDSGVQETATLSTSDLLSLQEYEEELRERIRAEVRAELESGQGEAR